MNKDKDKESKKGEKEKENENPPKPPADRVEKGGGETSKGNRENM